MSNHTSGSQRVLVVGAGSIGTRHLRVVRSLGYEVAGVDVDPSAFDASRAELGEFPTFTSLDAALEQRPRVVIIATPHHLHAEQSVAAMEAGAHVLCEKPLAHDVASGQRMIDAARRHGRVLHVGFVNRYHPCLLRLREHISAGKIGTPVGASADLGSYITLVNSRSRHQAKLFGSLLLDYTHQPDFLYWLLGTKPRRVYAIGSRRGNFELKSDPNSLAMIVEHDGDLVSEIHLDYCRLPQVSTCGVTGDLGYLLCDLMTGTITLGRRQEETATVEQISHDRDDLFREQFRQFMLAVEGKPAQIISGEEGLVSMKVVDAAIESMRTRLPVDIQDR